MTTETMREAVALPPRKIDEKGRCCGRKPIPYKRTNHWFCDRCCAAFSMDTGVQIDNWAWKRGTNGFVATYPESVHAQAMLTAWRRESGV